MPDFAPPTALRSAGNILRALANTPLGHRSFRALCRRGWLPARIVKSLPATEPFDVILPDGDSFQYAPTSFDHIGSLLRWGGLRYFEPETTHAFIELARNSQAFIDVGANTGFYTLVACTVNPRLRAMAFEPVPRVFERLRNNVELNAYDNRCDLHAAAVSDVNGFSVLHVPMSELPTSASMNPDGFRGQKGILAEVPSITLDSVCHELECVDLVKIDVEGFEDRVLGGMHNIINNFRPKLIVECNVDGPFKEVNDVLAQAGYTFYHLRDAGAVKRNSILPDERERFRNYLCVSREQDAALEFLR